MLLIFLFWAHGLILTYKVAKGDWVLSPLGYMTGLGTTVGLGIAAAMAAFVFGVGTFGGGDMATAMASGITGSIFVIIGAIIHGPFVAIALGELTTAASDEVMMGQSSVPKSRDRAQAARKRKDYDEAIALYLEAIELDPEDGLAYRELGDVYLDQGRPEAALGCLIAAYRAMDEADMRGPTALRIAELQADAGDLAGAQATLKQMASDLAGTRFERYASERLIQIA